MTSPNRDAAFEVALTYAKHGQGVFPLLGKAPFPGSKGFYDATVDVAQLKRWHKEHPGCNWGMRTLSEESALQIVVVDVDKSKVLDSGKVTPDGYDELEDLEMRFGELPPTVTVFTGGGGKHLYYLTEGRLRSGKLGASIDFKAEGGYVVLPESVHPDTHRSYVFEASSRLGEVDIAWLPEWVPGAVGRHQTIRPDSPDQEERFAPATSPLQVGSRHDYLIRYAGHIWNRGFNDVGIYQGMLRTENGRVCVPPMPEDTSPDGKAFKALLNTPWRYKWNAPTPVIWEPDDGDPDAVEGETELQAAHRRMMLRAPSEWLHLVEPPLEWIVEDLVLQGGLTMLAAKPKAGKSVFARQMALAVASGEPFLGMAVTQGPVLYFALEEYDRWVRSAFRSLGLTTDMPLYLRFFRPHKQFHEDLRLIIQDIKPALVIIDTATRLPRARNYEMGDYFGSSEWLEPLMDTAHELETAVLALYHNRKGSSSATGYASIENIMGSYAIAATIDQSIYINVESDEGRVFGTQGRFGSAKPIMLGYDEETGRLSVLGSKDEITKRRIRQDIMEAVTAHPNITLDAIKEEVTGKAQAVGEAVRELLDEGQVLRSERIGKEAARHWVNPMRFPLPDPSGELGSSTDNEVVLEAAGEPQWQML